MNKDPKEIKQHYKCLMSEKYLVLFEMSNNVYSQVDYLRILMNDFPGIEIGRKILAYSDDGKWTALHVLDKNNDSFGLQATDVTAEMIHDMFQSFAKSSY